MVIVPCIVANSSVLASTLSLISFGLGTARRCLDAPFGISTHVLVNSVMSCLWEMTISESNSHEGGDKIGQIHVVMMS